MEYKCEYCGSDADITRDHIIPKSYSDTTSFRDSEFNPIVYCCKHCNSTLGNRAPHTFEGRANYLYNKIKDKNAALLKIPDWTDDDYQGMNPKFARSIKTKEKKKKIIQQRLEHLDRVRFG
jgi:hypothetical protein